MEPRIKEAGSLGRELGSQRVGYEPLRSQRRFNRDILEPDLRYLGIPDRWEAVRVTPKSGTFKPGSLPVPDLNFDELSWAPGELSANKKLEPRLARLHTGAHTS